MFRNFRLAASTSVLALGLVAAAPGAQTPYGVTGAMSEARFVVALDAANTTELDLAKYIVHRTKNSNVREFAQRMIADHGTAAPELDAATRGTNLRPAPRDEAVTPTAARLIAMLQAEPGTQRDNDYMRLQIPAHRHVIELAQWEQQNGENAGLKTLAANLVPIAQQHLQMAQTYLTAHNLPPYAPRNGTDQPAPSSSPRP